MHDLENKKKQAQELLRKVSILRFEMKVNRYDPDNIQKGRMMLSNIADDLTSYAKVKVSPTIKVEEDKPKSKDDNKIVNDMSNIE